MLFPDENQDDAILSSLASEIIARPIPLIDPLPCDRWIARSALQKTIRRAEPTIAVRSLGNLFEHDRRSVWRHLTVIALEDVGVANIDLLRRIVAAQRNRAWRGTVGGDWPVMAEITRQLADSNHCQAACDLLLRSINDPSLQPIRNEALEADLGDLLAKVVDRSRPLMERGVAALAAAGGLADGQPFRDAAAVFELMQESASNPAVVVLCQAAWKICRNEMATLLPLVWEKWQENSVAEIADDALPAAQIVNGVPGYALDQFTRRGNILSRALLAESPDLASFLSDAGVATGSAARIIGDAIFLLEGGRVSRRLKWTTGDELRLPFRWMPAVSRLGSHLDQFLSLVDAKASQIAKLRRASLPPAATVDTY